MSTLHETMMIDYRWADRWKPKPVSDTDRHTRWLPSQCRSAFQAGVDEERAIALIEEELSKSRRPQWNEVKNAWDTVSNTERPDGVSYSQEALEREARLRERRIAKIWREHRFTLDDLEEMNKESDQSWRNWSVNDFLLDAYNEDDLICLGRESTSAITAPVSVWVQAGNSNGARLIVPSPMSKVWGTTVGGKKSQRCRDNGGSPRYVILENDLSSEHYVFSNGATIEDRENVCLSIIYYAFKHDFKQIKYIVRSGGKSVHAWVDAAYMQNWETVKEAFTVWWRPIGFDPAMAQCQQYGRLPQAIRENGKVQQLIYKRP